MQIPGSAGKVWTMIAGRIGAQALFCVRFGDPARQVRTHLANPH
jgi:hypothetical protein